jgi:carboxypeptidase Taq
MSTLEEFKALIAELQDLSSTASVLGWDQQTQMPLGGSLTRANQLSTLSRIIHQKNTSARMGELLDELEPQFSSQDDLDAVLVRYVRRDVERRRKLPTEFVAEITKARAISGKVWEEARAKNDFKSFQPHLEKMFEYALRIAEYQGYDEHPYDALLYDFDPGLKTSEVKTVFAQLRQDTVPLVHAIAQKSDRVDYSILEREYDETKQREFSLDVAQAFGYDFSRGRLDIAAHPFATNFSRDDVRMTTRYDRHYLPMAMFGTFHETGHALYEQGTGSELARTPLARGAWSTVHESQSRMWENLVGRSLAFWTHWFPRLQAIFPQQLEGLNAETFYRLVNRVRPSPIRVEADEITYNLHIMLRFEIELGMIEGKLKASELPEVWNAKMQEYLRITPKNDAEGVMQDVHWSEGLIGYFPTYSLGNILSVQLLQTARKDLGDLEGQWATGEYAPLLGWLREHVHQYGKRDLPPALIERVTGSPLTAKPYVAYLTRKFSELYGL